jgi:hypothetical protein
MMGLRSIWSHQLGCFAENPRGVQKQPEANLITVLDTLLMRESAFGENRNLP